MPRLKKMLSSPLRMLLKKVYQCSNYSLPTVTILITAFFCLVFVTDVVRHSLSLTTTTATSASTDHMTSQSDRGQGRGSHGSDVIGHMIRTGYNSADGDADDLNLKELDYGKWANCSWRRQRADTGRHRGLDDNETYLSLHGKPDKQVCVHPSLDPCAPGIRDFDSKVDPVVCNPEENWVFVQNGTFQISPRPRARYGKITCEYAPIVRGKNDFSARHAEHIKPMASGARLITDFFKVACISPSGKRYHNIHAGISYNPSLHARSDNIPMPKEAMGYSVLMFGFDSVSRMSWLRNLPKTREFFVDQLGGVELTGYNIVGDGTVQALLPILAGHSEHDLPTSRRGDPGAVTVDDYPWLWSEYKKRGYVTAWAEDMSYIGTFQYRLKGFTKQPTDHCMRTYFMLAEPMYPHHKRFCLGSEPRHRVFLGWFRDLYAMYGDKPKFMFGFHSEYSHNDNNQLKKIDEDFSGFLKDLHTKGHLDKTILVLMSDHGARFDDIRATAQGKLEERMPYFAFRFPADFQKRFPTQYQHFKTNANRLTTPFDIHETFHDILNVSRSRQFHFHNGGVSLFQEISLRRTCEDAGIKPHWCACLEWRLVDHNLHTNISSSVIAFINNMTLPQRHRCQYLKLKNVVNLLKFSPNSQLLKFEKSQDLHGDVPKFSNSSRLVEEYFQITMVTSPGDGMFEATVKRDLRRDVLVVNPREISRINRYGDSPSCIASDLPHLRPYCYCRQ